MTRTTTRTFSGLPADLDFAITTPADWVVLPIERTEPDFTKPEAVAPLAGVMAPYAAIVFAAAARPTYADGTLADWLGHLARAQGLDPGPIEQEAIGAHAGVGCWGVQVDGDTVVRVRVALFEDGDRIVIVTCMAPDTLWTASAPTFTELLRSFALASAKGSHVARAAGELPASTFATPRAANGDALDPEHPTNARLRDQGVGLVPRVLERDAARGTAKVAAGALLATLRVPSGWHVLDDGRRTLVFDAAGKTQVSLRRRARNGRTDDELLREKLAELYREWPELQHARSDADGLACLFIRNVAIDGKPIEQGYLLRPLDAETALEARLTSTPEDFPQACELADTLFADLPPLAGDPAAR